jgi:hypothetical protein
LFQSFVGIDRQYPFGSAGPSRLDQCHLVAALVPGASAGLGHQLKHLWVSPQERCGLVLRTIIDGDNAIDSGRNVF